LQGEAAYLFSLVYTSLGDILPRIQELWSITRKDDTKEGRLEAKKLLGEIIQVYIPLAQPVEHSLACIRGCESCADNVRLRQVIFLTLGVLVLLLREWGVGGYITSSGGWLVQTCTFARA